MVQQLNMNKKNKQIIISIVCILIGTLIGTITYAIFLYFRIAIFGWNLGLIFAPLVAGYVETYLANKFLGQNVGAISAFILFINTTFYSFILKNPTLNWNLITFFSIIIILQAAFPTLINYILLVVGGSIVSKLIKTVKNITKKIKHTIENRPIFFWDSSSDEIQTNVIPYFDEDESNEKLNSLNFFFMTSSDANTRKHKILKYYQRNLILEKDKHLIKIDPEKLELKYLTMIKEGKDEVLIKLAEDIKNDGGNGILDLSINYNLIGIGGEDIQITAMGMGVYIK